jgi:hypothetical protein
MKKLVVRVGKNLSADELLEALRESGDLVNLLLSDVEENDPRATADDGVMSVKPPARAGRHFGKICVANLYVSGITPGQPLCHSIRETEEIGPFFGQPLRQMASTLCVSHQLLLSDR